jgi:hypothetical protein
VSGGDALVALAGGAILTDGAGGRGFGPGGAAEHVVAVGGAGTARGVGVGEGIFEGSMMVMLMLLLLPFAMLFVSLIIVVIAMVTMVVW